MLSFAPPLKRNLVRKVKRRELLFELFCVFPSGIFNSKVFPLDQSFCGKLGPFLDPAIV